MSVWTRTVGNILVLTVLLVAISAFGLVAGAQEAADDDVIIRAISVEGNTHIDDAAILARVRSQIGEVANVTTLRSDAQRIVELGYFEEVDPRPIASGDGVEIVFVVREFPVVQGIDVVVHEDVVSADGVRALLDVDVGQVLNIERFSRSIEELPLMAAERLGYLIEPIRVDFMEGDIMLVEVTPYYIGDVIIEGNQKTKEAVILRELSFGPGDIASMEEIRTSLSKLGQLGFFEPIVPEFLETDEPFVIDILLPMTEVKTGRASFGAGYSSKDGLLGYIEVADRNSFGRGQTINVKWEFGGQHNTYDLGFFEPYLFGSNTSFGINLFRMTRTDQVLKYTSRSSGGDITLGRPLGRFTRGFLTFNVTNRENEPQSGSTIPASVDKTRSVTANVRTDTTDHLFYPTEGFKHDLSVEVARPVFDGNTDFTKYQTSLSRYIKVGGNDQTLAMRVMAGLGTGELPFDDQFRVGGADTLRGYRFGTFTGDKMLVAQAEYRIPIGDSVTGVIFADAGNAWADANLSLGDLKVGGGIGIRFDTPLGIIRLDYGMSGQGGEAYFSLGPTF